MVDAGLEDRALGDRGPSAFAGRRAESLHGAHQPPVTGIPGRQAEEGVSDPAVLERLGQNVVQGRAPPVGEPLGLHALGVDAPLEQVRPQHEEGVGGQQLEVELSVDVGSGATFGDEGP